MDLLLSVAGLVAVLLPAAWWAGLFVAAGDAAVRATSVAFVAALPVLGAGLLVFGLGADWGPAPAVGFGLLLAFSVVLFAGARGATEALAPPALRRRPLVAIRRAEPDRGPDRREDERDAWILAPGA